MEHFIKTTFELEQYQCRKCGRFFYIHKQDKSGIEFDFGCPFSCDDNGRYVRNIKTEFQQEDNMPKPKEDRYERGDI